MIDRLKDALSDRYRIERELGAGGMASVYLAADLKHDRQVAIKVLHPELSAVIGADRFLAEIRTTASLQHPHILPLFDSGEADGLLFYVMPYIAGETLRDLIDREKQLPVEDAVAIARKVASAIQSAHDNGVIHRDIKPANILLQRGEPLVADFGIALAVQEAGGRRLTETGLSIGTPYYMSPEQATADRDPDARSDLYSLACVLYELLAGDPPFTASTAQGVVAKILSGRPTPVRDARPSVPDHVDASLDRALQRLPADRFRTMSEFSEALAGRGVVPTGTRPVAVAGSGAGVGRWLWPAGLAAAVVVAAAGWLDRPAPVYDTPSHLAIPALNLGGTANAALRQIAVSPNGRTILYTGAEIGGSDNRTHRRDLDDVGIRPLTSTSPFLGSFTFSADGSEFFGMTQDGGLFRYGIDGSNEQRLMSLRAAPWMDWTSDGYLWFNDDNQRALTRIDPNGEVEVVLDGLLLGSTLQQILEGRGEALLVSQPRGVASGPLLLVDLESGEMTTLIPGDVAAARYTDGHLVTVLEVGTLQAARFDLATGRIVGPQIRLADDVVVDQGIAQMDASDEGTVVYIPNEPRGLAFVDRSGAVRPATSESENFHAPSFSPDGRRLAVDYTTTEGRNVWVMDIDGGVPSRATFAGNGHDARWMPDGERLTYLGESAVGESGVRVGIFTSRPGDVETDQLIADVQVSFTGDWLPDGSALVATGDAVGGDTGADITIIRNGGRGPIEPLIATRFEEMWPAVSPDGRWLAYGSNRSGTFEIYVRELGSGGPDLQVSVGGGTEPLWNRVPDAMELFYRSGPGAGSRMAAARIQTDPQLAVLEREDLFSIEDVPGGIPHTNYDVSPDGRTFAVVKFNWASRIMVIQNLAALVAQRESGGR